MPKGIIMKALSGYYYVLPEDNTTAPPVQCRGRGILKQKKITPLVGDQVIFEHTENGEGMVQEILPRSSELVRPPIANVEQAILVFSLKEPDLSLALLDKFLVHTENAGLKNVICLTKSDLISDEGFKKMDYTVEEIAQMYEKIGYPVYVISSKEMHGLDNIIENMKGSVSVLAGQSGAGKSSLLNAIKPSLHLETNAISSKLGRGKHTTRHVELIPLSQGGLVADTPGFSQLDFALIDEGELGSCFIEFAPLAQACRFRGCTHQHEPGCEVIAARERGEIFQHRYDHYLEFLLEMKEIKRRY